MSELSKFYIESEAEAIKVARDMQQQATGTDARADAIAQADAILRAAGLATYSESLEALRTAYADIQRLPGHTIDMLGRIEAIVARHMLTNPRHATPSRRTADGRSTRRCVAVPEAAGRERQALEVMTRLVEIADADPFTSIGHVLEHVVPEVREMVARGFAMRANALAATMLDYADQKMQDTREEFASKTA